MTSSPPLLNEMRRILAIATFRARGVSRGDQRGTFARKALLLYAKHELKCRLVIVVDSEQMAGQPPAVCSAISLPAASQRRSVVIETPKTSAASLMLTILSIVKAIA
jgi:hypothetical protein